MTLEQIEQRLNALQAENDKLIAELERLKAEEQSKEVKPWRAEYRSKYYYVSDGGVIDCHLEDYDECDNILHSRGNYYRTEALAEQDAKELALRGRVRQLRDALCEGNQFIDDGNNWYIIFSAKTAKYETSSNPYFRSIGNIYFDTYEHAQQACDILNKESDGNG